MRPILLMAVLAGALSGAAQATLVQRKDNGPPVGPASGGLEVTGPKGKVRLECWQDGQKIIDERELAVMSFGVPSQANALTFRRPDGTGIAASLIDRRRMACLVTDQD